MKDIDLSTEPNSTSIMPDSTGRTILIIDDNPASLSPLFQQLKQAGYKILVADDGQFALQQATETQPDIILLDVMMSDLDGFETCRRLKQNQATCHIPVIFMTAMASVENKLKGFDAGGVDYVTKPLQHREVLARLETHLANRYLQAALEKKIRQLEQALAEVKTLREILPICAYCGKIRDEEGVWHDLSSYLHSLGADLSHGICPDCYKANFPQFYTDA